MLQSQIWWQIWNPCTISFQNTCFKLFCDLYIFCNGGFQKALHSKINVFVKFEIAINLEITSWIKKNWIPSIWVTGTICMHFHQNLGRSRLILHFFGVIWGGMTKHYLFLDFIIWLHCVIMCTVCAYCKSTELVSLYIEYLTLNKYYYYCSELPFHHRFSLIISTISLDSKNVGHILDKHFCSYMLMIN